MGKLDDRVAIVTGAGQGIGKGIATAFAKEGASVAIVERNEVTCKATAEEIRNMGYKAVGLVCNVGDQISVESTITRIVSEIGSIDILVNNAQRFVQPRNIEDIEEDDWDKSLQVGLKSTWYCCKAVFPYMKNKGGKIINICSGAGITGVEGKAVYCATKEAVRTFSKIAAREWAKYNINVNVICPVAETPLTNFMKSVDPEGHRSLIQGTVMQKWGDPEIDIGRAAVFLASSDSDFITGQSLMVDGGGIML